MIVAILLSYLKRIGQRRHFRDVYWGVAAALLLVIAGGIAAYVFIDEYSGSNVQTYFETTTYLLAAGALTYMTFWMQSHSRTMSAELGRRSEEAINGRARLGIGLLAFQAVGREGLETMVFTLAIIFASSKQAGAPLHGNYLLLGAGLGLALALCVAFAIYRLGARLNLRRFFQVGPSREVRWVCPPPVSWRTPWKIFKVSVGCPLAGKCCGTRVTSSRRGAAAATFSTLSWVTPITPRCSKS